MINTVIGIVMVMVMVMVLVLVMVGIYVWATQRMNIERRIYHTNTTQLRRTRWRLLMLCCHTKANIPRHPLFSPSLSSMSLILSLWVPPHAIWIRMDCLSLTQALRQPFLFLRRCLISKPSIGKIHNIVSTLNLSLNLNLKPQISDQFLNTIYTNPNARWMIDAKAPDVSWSSCESTLW